MISSVFLNQEQRVPQKINGIQCLECHALMQKKKMYLRNIMFHYAAAQLLHEPCPRIMGYG